MKQIIFFEFGQRSLRLMRYDGNRYMDLDISGGYGSLYIPLMIHYVEEEYLIGDECFRFDVEDSSLLFTNIRLADKQARKDFFLKLSKKIQAVIRIEEPIDLVLIDRSNSFIKDIDKSYFIDLMIDQVRCITYEQALAGYVSKHCLEQDKYSIVFYDHDYMYEYRMFKYKSKYMLDIKSHYSFIGELEEAYLSLLAMDHYGSAYSSCNLHEQHVIAGLFHGQQASVQKQLSNGGNLNIYSSIVFPPKKIVIFAHQVQDVMDQVRSSLDQLLQHKNWKVMMDYPFVEKLLLNNHMDLALNKKLLLNGALNYIDGEEEIIIENTGHASVKIGLVNNNEFVILTDKLNQDYRCQLDVIASPGTKQVDLYMEKDDERFLIYELMIEGCHSLKRILIDLIFENDNKVKEVRYEFGNL